MSSFKTKFSKALAVVVPSAIMFLSLTATAISVVTADIIATREGAYMEYTDGSGNIFRCYVIDEAHDYVDISWSPKNASYPVSLTIPSVIYDDSESEPRTEYTVKEIADGGFRYCTSDTIELPDELDAIGSEAFAYSLNITSISLSYGITEIAPSTFLDCRRLTTVYYKDEDGDKTFSNSDITRIGDHAFDSCVNLSVFTCPSSVEYFGESCFQKCEKLLNFYFPGDPASIQVKPYAFADCKNLAMVYFETNMTKIEHHAFVDCAVNLRIDYTGSSSDKINEQDTSAGLDYKFGEDKDEDEHTYTYNHWRDVHISTNNNDLIPINPDESTVDVDGLFIYSIESGSFKLDSSDAPTRTTNVYFNVDGVDADYENGNDEEYVIIKKFIEPFDRVAGIYEYYNGTNSNDGFTLDLSAVNLIKNKKVKIIGKDAFANVSSLTKVIFNQNLVQIRNQAFFHCLNIAELDFSHCEDLKEISYDVFQECINGSDLGRNEVYNEALHSLDLPACLEYVGEFAFYNFIRLTGHITFGGINSKLKVIGAYAFAVNRNITDFGYTLSDDANVDLVLPWTLNDADAKTANYFHLHDDKSDSTRYVNIFYGGGSDNNNRKYLAADGKGYAIGTHAFDNATTFNSITMEQRYFFYYKKTAEGWQQITISGFDNGSPITLSKPGNAGDYYVDYSNNNALWIRGASTWERIQDSGDSNSFVTGEGHPTTNAIQADNGKYYTYYTNTAKNNEQETGSPIPASYNTSLASNTFVRCKNLIRFKSNANLCFIGNDALKGLDAVREVFLDSTKANAQTYSSHPWGMQDKDNAYGKDGVFHWNTTKNTPKTSMTNTVIYVSGPSGGKISTNTGGNWAWNADGAQPTYFNELGIDNANDSSRTQIPTMYNINFLAANDVLYLDPNSSSRQFVSAPVTLDDYTYGHSGKGVISLAKNSSGKYIVARYFCGVDSSGTSRYEDEIDLTGLEYDVNNTPNNANDDIDISNNIETIGEEAFAYDRDGGVSPGVYFVLPNTITEIGERAFYRKENNVNLGVRIVTYKSGNTIVAPGTDTYSGRKTNCETNEGGTTKGYCCLPTTLKQLKRSAFYNNRFTDIVINSGIKFIGNAAFYCHYSSNSKTANITVSTSTFGEDNQFTVVNNGVYYTKTVSSKTLIYQASGTATELEIDGGTIAVGMRAVANSNYNQIKLPDGLTTIYGGAFQNSKAITKVYGDGLEDLEYICAYRESGEVYQSGTHGAYFDNKDSRNTNKDANEQKYCLHSAFSGCSALATLDFTQMDSIVKIGARAFSNCTNLKYMTPTGDSYTFVTGGLGGTETTKTDSVLDLSDFAGHLTHIGSKAFEGCSNIKYTILPDTAPNNRGLAKTTTVDGDVRNVESTLNIGFDGGIIGNGNALVNTVLVGDTIVQANSKASYNGVNCKPGNHYKAVGGTAYYHIEVEDDIYKTDIGSYKYWTKYNGKYYLFTSGTQALAFMQSI